MSEEDVRMLLRCRCGAVFVAVFVAVAIVVVLVVEGKDDWNGRRTVEVKRRSGDGMGGGTSMEKASPKLASTFLQKAKRYAGREG